MKTLGHKREEYLMYFARSCSIVMTVVPGMVLARSLTIADYGTFLQIQLIVQCVVLSLTLGVQRGVYYFASAEKDSQSQTLYHLLNFLIIIAIISCFVVGIGNSYVSIWMNNPQLEYLSLGIILLLFGRIGSSSNQQFFIVQGRVARAAGMQIFSSIFVGGLFILGGFYGVPVQSLLLFEAFVLILVIFIQYYSIRKLICWLKIFTVSKLNSYLRYILPLSVSAICSMVARQAGQLYVASCFSVDQFAIYARGATEIPIAAVVTYSIASLISPKLVRAHRNEDTMTFKVIWHSAIIQASVIIVPFALIFFYYRQEVIEIMYGQMYLESAPVFGIYALILFTQICSFDAVALCLGATWLVLCMALVQAVGTLGGSFVLIKYFGILGPAIATLLSSSAVAALYVFFIARRNKYSIYSSFPFKKFIELLGICLISFLFNHIIYKLLFDIPIQAVIKMMISTSIAGFFYFILLRFTRFN